MWEGKNCNLNNTPWILQTFLYNLEIWFPKVNLLSTSEPKNKALSDLKKSLSSYIIFNVSLICLFLKTTNFVLLKCKDKKFKFNHLTTALNSNDKVSRKHLTSLLLLYKVVSSSYKIDFDDFKQFGRSLIYKKNNIRPYTEPCGIQGTIGK